jgi:hypothetical protein
LQQSGNIGQTNLHCKEGDPENLVAKRSPTRFESDFTDKQTDKQSKGRHIAKSIKDQRKTSQRQQYLE